MSFWAISSRAATTEQSSTCDVRKAADMKKTITLLFVCIVFALSIAGCSTKYHEDEFIGRTSKDIVQEFGSFDCVGMPAREDGLYRNCKCGYTIKERQKGFLGTSPEILFFITFDEDGIAIACKEGYRPGG